ncbi:MAG: cytochrome P450, partial [Gammaproteobacteria bacterium]
ASAEVDVAGVRITAGEIVVVSLGAANRDPAEFPEPQALRLSRTANRHLSFAPGQHHCLGAALARLQLEIGLGTLLANLPAFALATDSTALDWRHGMLGARNLAALPVTW